MLEEEDRLLGDKNLSISLRQIFKENQTVLRFHHLIRQLRQQFLARQNPINLVQDQSLLIFPKHQITLILSNKLHRVSYFHQNSMIRDTVYKFISKIITIVRVEMINKMAVKFGIQNLPVIAFHQQDNQRVTISLLERQKSANREIISK